MSVRPDHFTSPTGPIIYVSGVEREGFARLVVAPRPAICITLSLRLGCRAGLGVYVAGCQFNDSV